MDNLSISETDEHSTTTQEVAVPPDVAAYVETTSEEHIDVPVTEEGEDDEGTVIAQSKRARSPLPISESSGPSVDPGPGGFIGSSKLAAQLFSLIKRMYHHIILII